MTIPEIRAELMLIAILVDLYDEQLAERIRFLANETRRRPPVRPRQFNGPETKIQRSQVVGYFMANPKATFHDAAEFFGVNIRAISYAYRGHRK